MNDIYVYIYPPRALGVDKLFGENIGSKCVVES